MEEAVFWSSMHSLGPEDESEQQSSPSHPRAVSEDVSSLPCLPPTQPGNRVVCSPDTCYGLRIDFYIFPMLIHSMLFSLGLSFLICKMKMIMVATLWIAQGLKELIIWVVRMVPGIW